MSNFRPSRSWALTALLGLLMSGEAPRVAAQAPAPAPSPKKSVYGKLESVDKQLNGLFMRSDDNRRLAWRFDRPVIAEMDRFAKPGDAMIVIYRQTSPNEKRVTAIAFPGAASAPTYVNLTGDRVVLRSAPMVDGACSNTNPDAVQETVIPRDGRAETAEACWCCASADETCTPANKTGLGRALLVGCFE